MTGEDSQRIPGEIFEDHASRFVIQTLPFGVVREVQAVARGVDRLVKGDGDVSTGLPLAKAVFILCPGAGGSMWNMLDNGEGTTYECAYQCKGRKRDGIEP